MRVDDKINEIHPVKNLPAKTRANSIETMNFKDKIITRNNTDLSCFVAITGRSLMKWTLLQ